METGVKPNEDMYPLSPDFFLSFVFSFFAFFVTGYLCYLTGPHQKLKTPWNYLLVGLNVATNANF